MNLGILKQTTSKKNSFRREQHKKFQSVFQSKMLDSRIAKCGQTNKKAIFNARKHNLQRQQKFVKIQTIKMAARRLKLFPMRDCEPENINI